MKVTYNNKYKERKPKEAVQVIKDFFNKYKYTIKEVTILQKTDFIWCCNLSLYFKDHFICSAYGAGTTKDFCLASGYSKLYEIFANRQPIFDNIVLTDKLQSLLYEQQGCTFKAGEQKLLVDQLCLDSNIKQMLLQLNVNYRDSKFEPVLKSMVRNNTFIGEPAVSLTTGNVVYYNPLLLKLVIGSTGTAAGNSLEEALVHGISEIVEKQTAYLFGQNDTLQYYQINHATLKSKVTQLAIEQLQTAGYEVFIIDLSYNFDWPVVLVAAYNKATKNYTSFFSAFPEFELAVEQAICKCCQKVISFGTESVYAADSVLFKLFEHTMSGNKNILIASRDYNNISEHALLTTKLVDTCNYNCFLKSKAYSNLELLNSYKNLFIRHDTDIFMFDNSLCDEFRAVTVYCPDFMPPTFDEKLDPSSIVPPEEVFEATLKEHEQLSKMMIKNFSKYFKGLPLVIFPKESYFALQIDFTGSLLGSLFEDVDDINVLYEIYSCLYETPYASYINKYATLFKYRINNYTKEEVKEIFNFCGEDFSDIDWYCCADIHYIYENVLLPAFNEIYNNEFFEGLLAPFLNSYK